MESKVSSESLRHLGAMRVTIPVSVAYNLDSLQTGIANILNHVGCAACCSGVDINFQTEREFILTEDLKVRANTAALATNQLGARVNRIGVKRGHSIEQIKAVIARVAGEAGHPHCCSGFDFSFQEEVEQIG